MRVEQVIKMLNTNNTTGIKSVQLNTEKYSEPVYITHDPYQGLLTVSDPYGESKSICFCNYSLEAKIKQIIEEYFPIATAEQREKEEELNWSSDNYILNSY